MPEMSKLRKEDLSLYYYIKDRVLCNFIETEEYVPLQYIEELSCRYESEVYAANSSMIPSPIERGRGWVYFDKVVNNNGLCIDSYTTTSGYRPDGTYVAYGTPEQSNMIVVRDVDGTVISGTEYMIDYIDGRVVTSGTCSPYTVDYSFHYIAVVDEWAAIEASDPPVIVIDIMGTDKTGYQLGGGKKATRKVDIHVFASDPAERNDIVEALYDGLYLKSAPVYSFPNGSVLDYDGTFFGRKENMNKLETLFDRSRESGIIGNMEFNNVTSRHVNLPLLMTRSTDEVMLSDLNAYRSKVSFELVTYVNPEEVQ